MWRCLAQQLSRRAVVTMMTRATVRVPVVVYVHLPVMVAAQAHHRDPLPEVLPLVAHPLVAHHVLIVVRNAVAAVAAVVRINVQLAVEESVKPLVEVHVKINVEAVAQTNVLVMVRIVRVHRVENRVRVRLGHIRLQMMI